MGKLISNIQNYPLSQGAVAYSNRTLLDNQFRIQDQSPEDYFRMLFEFSKDVYFFNEGGSKANRWNDLIGQDSIFQYSRFLTISVAELHRFFIDLPQSNHFNSDTELTEDEYEVLGYQRLQLIQYLFSFYKTIGQVVRDEKSDQALSILKSDPIAKLFLAYETLMKECLGSNSPLISMNNRKPVENFNEVQIPLIDDDFTVTLTDYYNPTSITGAEVLGIYATNFDKIKAANEYAHSIFNGILQIHQAFHHWARRRLNELTTSTNTHQPHIALLIAFCKLRLLYDARFNQLVHANTKFIYEKILMIGREVILPDTALISIELAKNVASYFVERNTLFKGGKNALSKQVYYQSTEDLVTNSAKIAFIKSIVRVYRQQQLFTVTATHDAASQEWQVNNGWLPFNDLGESSTGIAFESKMLQTEWKKGVKINFVFTFYEDVPSANNINEKFELIILTTDAKEISLPIHAVVTDDHKLTVTGEVEKDIKNVKEGINAKIKLVSPSKDEHSDSSYGVLYSFLLSHNLSTVSVKLDQHLFAPAGINASTGNIEGGGGFMAFGSQSLKGSSFQVLHPFIRFINEVKIQIDWGETLKENVSAKINAQNVTFDDDDESSIVTEIVQNGPRLTVKLREDVTYNMKSTVTNDSTTSTITSKIPSVIMVKEIKLTADVEETIYAVDGPIWMRREMYFNRPHIIKSLRIPFTSKARQKRKIYERYFQFSRRLFRDYYNNRIAHIYPLGELETNKTSGLTLLPDYSILGFNDYEADLYIGLTGITPGQSISLLFEIADETAEQSQLEAKIKWFVITGNAFEEIDPSRVTDTTNHFLQSGIVRLTLPESATNNNTIVTGNNAYWLVARCDRNYEVVANIKSIKTNGLAVVRVLDELNQEVKTSVPPGTIENIFPKTANVKSVTQGTPSQHGREAESDQHYFWRVSQRLRHKRRAIQQWDYEQLVLEQFSNIYKVKCLNHAYYNADEAVIHARPANVIISLIPHFVINPGDANFQPAIPVSRLLEIKDYLLGKTTAFNQLQVLNTQWDEVQLTLEVVLQRNVLDLVFYREKLNQDIKQFLAPWAFEATGQPVLSEKMYVAAIVDFMDELPYVHHIRALKIFKNAVEVFDEVIASSEIHLLTSASDHSITVFEYGK